MKVLSDVFHLDFTIAITKLSLDKKWETKVIFEFANRIEIQIALSRLINSYLLVDDKQRLINAVCKSGPRTKALSVESVNIFAMWAIQNRAQEIDDSTAVVSFYVDYVSGTMGPELLSLGQDVSKNDRNDASLVAARDLC